MSDIAILFNSLGLKYSVELQMEIIWSCETALSLLVFMLFWLTPRKVWQKPGICYNKQLETCPGRWFQMVADFPGWEAKKALVALPAFPHFDTAPKLPDVVTACPPSFRQQQYLSQGLAV